MCLCKSGVEGYVLFRFWYLAVSIALTCCSRKWIQGFQSLQVHQGGAPWITEAPGFPRARGAPGAPGAPKAPGAPGAPKDPGAPEAHMSHGTPVSHQNLTMP